MIIDDHEIVRRGIAEIVDRDDALEVVAEAGSVLMPCAAPTWCVPT